MPTFVQLPQGYNSQCYWHQRGEREGCGEEGNQEVEGRKTGISLMRLASIPSTNCYFSQMVWGNFLHKVLIHKLLFKWMLTKSLRLFRKIFDHIFYLLISEMSSFFFPSSPTGQTTGSQKAG